MERELPAHDALLYCIAVESDPKSCRNADIVESDEGKGHLVAVTTKVRTKEIRASGGANCEVAPMNCMMAVRDLNSRNPSERMYKCTNDSS